jgi:DNA-directed RNA polymerase
MYYARENAPLSAQMWCKFPRVIQIDTKFANFAGLYFPHFTTFRGQTLQFYYNFNMLFLAVVRDFVLLA